MEQKKTLWIIAASGLFLLFVLGVALLLNSKPTNTPTTASITPIEKTPVSVQPNVTPVATPSTSQALDSNTLAFQEIENNDSSQLPSAENTINAETADITINANTTNIELKTVASPSSNITATSRAGEEALANASNKTYSPTPSANTTKDVATNTTSSTTSTKNTATSSTTKTVAKSSNNASATAKASTSSAALSTKYWVQAASFTNKKSADNARTALDDNKIPAEVFTYKDNGDTLFYRVRVGPYTTKSEAEYWKNRICSIDLFKDTQSYVTAVQM